MLLGHSASIVQEEEGEEMLAVRVMVPPVIPHIFENKIYLNHIVNVSKSIVLSKY